MAGRTIATCLGEQLQRLFCISIATCLEEQLQRVWKKAKEVKKIICSIRIAPFL
jgi:hypothetical protein